MNMISQCQVCHGEKVITYQSMLGVMVTAPCPKCNKPRDERITAPVEVQINHARRQSFVDWDAEQRHLQQLHDDLRGQCDG